MIESITIQNFLCYRERTELSLLASKKSTGNEMWYKEKDGKHILRLVLLLGPNSSGKSAAINAIRELCLIATRRFEKSESLPYRPFEFDETSRKTPTELSITYYIGELRYRYTVKYMEHVLEEELRLLSGRTSLVYSRKLDDDGGVSVKYGTLFKVSTADRQQIRYNLHDGTTIMSVVGMLSVENSTLNENFRFLSSIVNATPKRHVSTSELLDSGDKDYDMRKKEFVLKVMGQAGFLISDYSFSHIDDKTISWDSENDSELGREMLLNEHVRGQRPYKYLWLHHQIDDKQYPMDFESESDGTMETLQLLAHIYDIANRHGVSYCDNMGTHIHPALLTLLLRVYLQSSSDCQLIAATNDLSVLATDFLRRDSIRLVAKDDSGASSIGNMEYVHSTVNFLNYYINKVCGNISKLMDDEGFLSSVKDMLHGNA